MLYNNIYIYINIIFFSVKERLNWFLVLLKKEKKLKIKKRKKVLTSIEGLLNELTFNRGFI